jgi:hypothetical protein
MDYAILEITCYNINVEEDDDPRKVNIAEIKGHRDMEDQELNCHSLDNRSR